jgi:hypothetical protein
MLVNLFADVVVVVAAEIANTLPNIEEKPYADNLTL